MASNSFGTLDDLRNYINPYLSVKPVSIKNLSSILDMNTFQPYLTLEVGKNYWETKIASESENSHNWDELFNIEFDQTSNLILSLFDKDDYGTDTYIASYLIPYSKVSNWKEPKKIYIRVPEEANEDEKLNFSEWIVKEDYDGCVLIVELSYLDAEFLCGLRAEIHHHRNIVRGKDAYTLYEVVIKRNDGHNWRVELRYSDFLVIRNEISQIIPGITMLPFPQKTYFDWLSRFCQCTSRFNETRIQHRKDGLQFFLNIVLDNIKEFESEAITNLLQIPQYQ